MENESYLCGEKYRTNYLSKKPGGDTVVLEYMNQTVEYDRIKYAHGYIKRIVENNGGGIKAIWVKGSKGSTIHTFETDGEEYRPISKIVKCPIPGIDAIGF